MTINMFKPDKGRIIGAIRRIFSMSNLYKFCKNRNLVEETGPRGGKMLRCDCCGNNFPWSKTQLDHIDEVIPIDRTAESMGLDEIVSRMWCSPDNLQVLCSECHDIKTQEANKERREFKKRAKNDV